MSSTKKKPKQEPKSAGGIILPPAAQGLTQVSMKTYSIGGVDAQAPDDPRITLSVQPAALQSAAHHLGFLGALLNLSNALVREVTRLREHAGLPAWTHDLGADPDASGASEEEDTKA